jgi:hypothetical protein
VASGLLGCSERTLGHVMAYVRATAVVLSGLAVLEAGIAYELDVVDLDPKHG